MNNYKNFINYFKRSDGTAPLGMGMLVAGLILFWLGWYFYWIFFYIGIPMIPIGFALYIYGTTGRIDESELRKIIQQKSDAITFDDVKESAEFRKRLSKNPIEETFGEYVFGTNVLMKKAKSGAIVSSEYVCGKMLVLSDALFIRTHSFSFVSNKEKQNEIEIPFSSIEKIAMEHENKRYMVNNKELATKVSALVITHEGIKTRLPRKDDIYADELVVTLNRLIKNA